MEGTDDAEAGVRESSHCKVLKCVTVEWVRILEEAKHREHLTNMGLFRFCHEVDWNDRNRRCRDGMVVEFVGNFRSLGDVAGAEGQTQVAGRSIPVTLNSIGETFHLVNGDDLWSKCSGKKEKSLKSYLPGSTYTNGGYALSKCTDKDVKERLQFHSVAVEMRKATGALSKGIVYDVENSANKNWYKDFGERLLKKLHKASTDIRRDDPECKTNICIGAQVRAIILAVIAADPIVAAATAADVADVAPFPEAAPDPNVAAASLAVSSGIGAGEADAAPFPDSASDPDVAAASVAVSAGIGAQEAATERGGVEVGAHVAGFSVQCNEEAWADIPVQVGDTVEGGEPCEAVDSIQQTALIEQDEIECMEHLEALSKEEDAGHPMQTEDSKVMSKGTRVGHKSLPTGEAMQENAIEKKQGKGSWNASKQHEEGTKGAKGMLRGDLDYGKETGNTSDGWESDAMDLACPQVKGRVQNRLVMVSNSNGVNAEESDGMLQDRDEASSQSSKEGIKLSRERRKFTDEETAAIVEGQKMYGNRWTWIKNWKSDVFKHRTGVDLKDKYRNILREKRLKQ